MRTASGLIILLLLIAIAVGALYLIGGGWWLPATVAIVIGLFITKGPEYRAREARWNHRRDWERRNPRKR